mmetsp:Transcript_7593/g.17431  ORF Transcript_7593/g.17431 Transcript_7593/m.17431 type:complete len:704 (-) Transcript_7593:357-2468(-)
MTDSPKRQQTDANFMSGRTIEPTMCNRGERENFALGNDDNNSENYHDGDSDHPSPNDDMFQAENSGKRPKKRAIACDICRKSKKACDSNGVDPCASCVLRNLNCVFSEQRRRGPAKKKAVPPGGISMGGQMGGQMVAQLGPMRGQVLPQMQGHTSGHIGGGHVAGSMSTMPGSMSSSMGGQMLSGQPMGGKMVPGQMLGGHMGGPLGPSLPVSSQMSGGPMGGMVTGPMGGIASPSLSKPYSELNSFNPTASQILSDESTLISLVDMFLSAYGPLFSFANRETLIHPRSPPQYLITYSALTLASRGTGNVALRETLSNQARQLAMSLFDNFSVDTAQGFIILSYSFHGTSAHLGTHYGIIAQSQAKWLDNHGLSDGSLRREGLLSRAFSDSEGLSDYLTSPAISHNIAQDKKLQEQVLRAVFNMQGELLKACDSFRTIFFQDSLCDLVANRPTPICVSQPFSKIALSMCDRALNNLQHTMFARATILEWSFRLALHGLKVMVLACSAQTREALSIVEEILFSIDRESTLELTLPLVVPHLVFIGRVSIENHRSDLHARVFQALSRLSQWHKTAGTGLEGLRKLTERQSSWTPRLEMRPGLDMRPLDGSSMLPSLDRPDMRPPDMRPADIRPPLEFRASADMRLSDLRSSVDGPSLELRPSVELRPSSPPWTLNSLPSSGLSASSRSSHGMIMGIPQLGQLGRH